MLKFDLILELSYPFWVCLLYGFRELYNVIHIYQFTDELLHETIVTMTNLSNKTVNYLFWRLGSELMSDF